MVQRGEAMLLDRLDLLRTELGQRLAFEGERAEGAVALVPPGAAGDLRHFRDRQSAATLAIEFGEAGEGDMADIEIEPHADRVGRDQIVDLACLVHRDLGVAGARGERAHHHRRPAARPPEHLGDRIDLLGREGDDRRAGRQARQLGGAGIGERGKAGAADDLCPRQQGADHRLQAFGAENHRLLPAARVQQPIGEDVAPLGIGAELRLIERDEGEIAIGRHRFSGAAIPARLFGEDLLLAGEQRDLVRPLYRHDPVVDLASQQPEREAHQAGGMAAHPFDREVGLSGIGRAEHRLHGPGGIIAHRP